MNFQQKSSFYNFISVCVILTQKKQFTSVLQNERSKKLFKINLKHLQVEHSHDMLLLHLCYHWEFEI